MTIDEGDGKICVLASYAIKISSRATEERAVGGTKSDELFEL